MNPKVSKDLIETYKFYLKMPFWALCEAEDLFNGYTQFYGRYNLDPVTHSWIGRKFFSLWTKTESLSEDFKSCSENKKTSDPFKVLYDAIKDDTILAYAIKMIGAEYSNLPGGIMYFIKPQDAISVAVTRGIILPMELQIAANLHQIGKFVKPPLSLSKARPIKRQALARALWWKYPNESISEITRKLKNYKKNFRCDFVNDSPNRIREVVKGLKPLDCASPPTVPWIVNKRDGVVAFDFQGLHIIVDTIADLLIKGNHKITEKELLEHPLISCYSSEGGYAVENIIKFSLKDTFEYLYRINHD